MAVRDDFAAGEVLAAADLNDTFASKLDLAGGKILQIVRATDTTLRTTTSTSYVDANISVTITPQINTSAILLVWSFLGAHTGTSDYANYSITDNSNNAISGAENGFLGSATTATIYGNQVVIAYATPATTSATTYKGRFKVTTNGTNTLSNGSMTGQLYAIEVSA